MNDEVIVDKGNYCVIIRMKKNSRIKIGAKGMKEFEAGFYVYVGSALNSLSKRIKRHVSDDKKKHWHADYLLLDKNTEVDEVIYTYCTDKIECQIANNIMKDSIDNIEDFGCSDCNCVSHLYYFNSYEDALKSCVESYEKINYKAYFWSEENSEQNKKI